MATRSPNRRARAAAPAAKARPRRIRKGQGARSSRSREEPTRTAARSREEPTRTAARSREEPTRTAARSHTKPAGAARRSRATPAPVLRFKPGDRVLIRKGNPKGHCRTPYYVRGKVGVVERCLGFFRNPEQLAYGRPGLPKAALYAVRFAQPELWRNYPGPGTDTLVAELSDFWLDAA